MNNVRKTTSVDGALYELVARGVKDNYFWKDENTSVHPFKWNYESYPGCLPEVRLLPPQYPVKFGQKTSWIMDLPGDVLVDVRLRIDLPSWIPNAERMLNTKSLTRIYHTAVNRVDTSGAAVGYTNGIGYFLFRRIELLQDGQLIWEASGDALYTAHLTDKSWNRHILENKLAGIHGGSELEIQKNATPGQLILKIPIPGCMQKDDKGFPICALRSQNFQLRVTLRDWKELIETSGGDYNYNPFSKSFVQKTSPTGSIAQFTTLSELEFGQPQITLETTQVYLLNEDRRALEQQKMEIPFLRYYENVYSFGPADYAPFEKGAATSYVTRFVDACFIGRRMMTFFRNSRDIMKGQLWKFENSDVSNGNYYNEANFIIAGQNREGAWDSLVFQKLVNHAKERHNSARNVLLMNWTSGWSVSANPDTLEPEGGINFSTAEKPTLRIGLENVGINPVIGYKEIFMNSVVESWALYVVENGHGKLLFEN